MRLAAEAGLAALALTDHDTVDGLDEAHAAAAELGLLFVPGVEVSASEAGSCTLHLLAYGIDPADPGLLALLGRLRSARIRRLEALLRGLRLSGPRPSVDDVLAEAAGAPPGRPHVAAALVRSGAVRTRADAFVRYLSDARVAGLPTGFPPVGEVVDTVHRAGGLVAWAHPLMHGFDARRLDALVRLGLDAVEVWHPSARPAHVRILRSAAARYGLLETGGSDCHGDAAGVRALQEGPVSLELVERLRARAGRRSHLRGGKIPA